MENKYSEVLMYQTDDGITRIEVKYEEDTVWLTAGHMAELFGRDSKTIRKHITNIFSEGELSENSTVAKFATVQLEGSRKVGRDIEYYNLDVIISVGYRVKSLRGTQFRIWANSILKEYIIKGFALDDIKLKENGGGTYYEELLERIRDIRSSEKVFWRKVLDIFATSIDYNPRGEETKLFFSIVQNKIHYAAHGHTAAEIVYDRIDSTKEHLGLTNWNGQNLGKKDIIIAKNYLSEEELKVLNIYVSMYLDFAELQALRRNPMYMKNWLDIMDRFIHASGDELLENAGKISHHEALEKAFKEYEIYRQERLNDKSKVELDFEHLLSKVDEIK